MSSGMGHFSQLVAGWLFARLRFWEVSSVPLAIQSSTGKIALSTLRHLVQLSPLPPIFFSSTGRTALSTVRHLAQLARLPSSLLSLLTLRQPGGRGGSSLWDRRDGLHSYVTQYWATHPWYAVLGGFPLVRGIGLLTPGTQYWALEYLITDASEFAITSGPW